MSVAAKKTVELFFDVLSPYTWIAFESLCRYQNKWNINLKLRPVLLGGIMQQSGNKPPASVPAKGVYMIQDLARLRQLYQIPINPLSNPAEVLLVKGSLNAQRFITAVQLERPELIERLCRELWMRIWSRDEDITSFDSLKEAAKKVGLSDSDTEAFLKQTKDNKVKDILKQTTQEAIDAGAFGVPTIVVHDGSNQKHLIFGSDRLEVIAMLLNEKYLGPLPELAQSKL